MPNAHEYTIRLDKSVEGEEAAAAAARAEAVAALEAAMAAKEEQARMLEGGDDYDEEEDEPVDSAAEALAQQVFARAQAREGGVDAEGRARGRQRWRKLRAVLSWAVVPRGRLGGTGRSTASVGPSPAHAPPIIAPGQRTV